MVGALKTWFRATIDVRRGEYAVLALMTAYGFLSITSYYVIKPARNSIFVDRVGADQLPWVYVATAVILVFVMAGYSTYVDRVGPRTLIFSSMAALGASLVGFWWLLSNREGLASSGAFYVFTKLYPLFLVSQFWLVANLLFTTAQARRLFGLIGMGLILGGIAGSSISGFAAERVGTEPLLLVAAGILALCALVVVVLGPRIREGGGEVSGRLTEGISGGAVRLLTESAHLRTVAMVLGLAVVVGTLLDWQLNRAVELFVEGEDAKTEFFGRFYAALNVASVAIQVVLTSYVLRRFGIGLAVLVLPVALAGASVAILLFPLLWVVALGKGAEGALRYSLDQSTRELLFLPVPTDVKYKVKPLIDLTVYRAGTGLGGVLLLIFVNGLGVPLRWISLITLAAVGMWLVTAIRMRTEFAESLRRLIGVRDVRLDELIVGRLCAEAIEEIEGVLRRGTEREVLYALALLEHAPATETVDAVANLLGHDSADVRARAVSLLTEMGALSAYESVKKLLRDEPLEVRIEAIRFVCDVGGGDPEEVMAGFLEDDTSEVRIGAVGCLLRYGGADQREAGLREVVALAGHEDPTRREVAAELLGRMDSLPTPAEGLLERLARDPDPTVCLRAMRAIGRAGVHSLAPLLLARLDDPRYRPAVSEALVSFGPKIHHELLDLLADEGRTIEGRAQVPPLLVPDAEQDVLARLWAMLPSLPRELRYHGLKAVNKLNRNRTALSFDELDAASLVRLELKEAAARLILHERCVAEGDDPLLCSLLLQRSMEAEERAVRALAVEGHQSELYAAFTALTSPRTTDRQLGFELLDTLLPQKYRHLFDPLMNPDANPRSRAATIIDTFDLSRRGRNEELEVMARQDDDVWLQALAGRARARSGVTDDPVGRPLTESMRDHELMGLLDVPPNEGKLMDVLERGEVLGQAKIFASLRVEDLAAIAALTEKESFSEGDVLFEEGEPGRVLYVVVEGRVCAVKNDRVLFQAGRGRSVGSLSVLDGRPTDYQAKADGDTVALRLDREPFTRFLESRGTAVMSVMRYLTGVVRGLNEAPDRAGTGEAV